MYKTCTKYVMETRLKKWRLGGRRFSADIPGQENLGFSP